MLHDRGDPPVLADDAAVAARVGHRGRQHGRRGAGAAVPRHQPVDRLAGEERDIPGEHHDGPPLPFQRSLGLQQGVSGAQLRFLDDHSEVCAGREALAHQLGLVADDNDGGRRPQTVSRAQHVLNQRETARLVEDLGEGGLHPGAPPGSEDDDMQVGHAGDATSVA